MEFRPLPLPTPHISRPARHAAAILSGLCLSSLIAGCAGQQTQNAATAPAPAEGTAYSQVASVTVPAPGNKLVGDIIYADQSTGFVYFSDVANHTVDVVDGKTGKLLKQAPNPTGGGGIVADGNGHIWTGSPSGKVPVLADQAPFNAVATIDVHAPADEIGYDSNDSIIAVTNPKATTNGAPTPWVTLIDAKQYKVLGHVPIPDAGADALEQPQWNPGTSTFVESVRATKENPHGEIVEIDPTSLTIPKILPLTTDCEPAGLAVAPGNRALLGCNVGGPVLMDLGTGKVLDNYSGKNASGADEVFYDSADGRFYAAEAGALGPNTPRLNPPTVMVVDASSGKFITNIDLGGTAVGFHQVAAAFNPARAFLAEKDGIHVYGAEQTKTQ